MTPEQKAKDICMKFYEYSDLLFDTLSWIQVKECALIVANENMNCDKYINDIKDHTNWVNYWIEVKYEIEKL